MRSDDMRARFFTATAKLNGAVKILALLSAAAAILPAQPVQQVHANPDCQFFFTLSTASSLPTGSGFDNRQQGCSTWAMSYVNSGFTGLTVTLQSAPNNAGSAGTFAAGFPVQQTSISGSNAITDTTGGFWWVQGTNAFVRVNLSGLSGSGVVNGAVYGWRIPNAGGGTNGAIVCLTGDVAAGSGSGCLTATVEGIEGVPFCTGYTPANGDYVQYTTGGTPNPCYTAVAGTGSLSVSGFFLTDGTHYYIGPTFQQATLPSAGDFSWVNQGGATEVASGNALVLTAPSGSGDNLRLRVQNIGSNTILTVNLSCTTQVENFESCGVAFYESATGKIIEFLSDNSNTTANCVPPGSASACVGTGLTVNRFTNSTTYSASVFRQNFAAWKTQWVQLEISGGNLFFRTSQDGVNFVQQYKEASNAFFTTAPNQWGYVANSNNSVSSQPAIATLFSFKMQ